MTDNLHEPLDKVGITEADRRAARARLAAGDDRETYLRIADDLIQRALDAETIEVATAYHYAANRIILRGNVNEPCPLTREPHHWAVVHRKGPADPLARTECQGCSAVQIPQYPLVAVDPETVEACSDCGSAKLVSEACGELHGAAARPGLAGWAFR